MIKPKIRAGSVRGVLKCAACSKVALSPVKKACGAIICFQCLKRGGISYIRRPEFFNCPVCSKDAKDCPEVSFSDREMTELNMLQVYCPNQTMGCPRLISVLNALDHIRVCPHGEVRCLSCENQVSRSMMPEHRRTLCPHRILTCSACEAPIQASSLYEHCRECHEICARCDQRPARHHSYSHKNQSKCPMCTSFVPSCTHIGHVRARHTMQILKDLPEQRDMLLEMGISKLSSSSLSFDTLTKEMTEASTAISSITYALSMKLLGKDPDEKPYNMGNKDEPPVPIPTGEECYRVLIIEHPGFGLGSGRLVWKTDIASTTRGGVVHAGLVPVNDDGSLPEAYAALMSSGGGLMKKKQPRGGDGDGDGDDGLHAPATPEDLPLLCRSVVAFSGRNEGQCCTYELNTDRRTLRCRHTLDKAQSYAPYNRVRLAFITPRGFTAQGYDFKQHFDPESKVKCPHHNDTSRPCGWVGTGLQVRQHVEEDCMTAAIPCPNGPPYLIRDVDGMWCREVVPRYLMAEHLMDACQHHCCSGCQTMIGDTAAFVDHLNTCPDFSALIGHWDPDTRMGKKLMLSEDDTKVLRLRYPTRTGRELIPEGLLTQHVGGFNWGVVEVCFKMAHFVTASSGLRVGVCREDGNILDASSVALSGYAEMFVGNVKEATLGFPYEYCCHAAVTVRLDMMKRQVHWIIGSDIRNIVSYDLPTTTSAGESSPYTFGASLIVDSSLSIQNYRVLNLSQARWMPCPHVKDRRMPCSWEGYGADLPAHLSLHCAVHQVPCPNACNGCKHVCRRVDLEEHIRKYCKRHRCPGCRAVVHSRDRVQHLNTCGPNLKLVARWDPLRMNPSQLEFLDSVGVCVQPTTRPRGEGASALVGGPGFSFGIVEWDIQLAKDKTGTPSSCSYVGLCVPRAGYGAYPGHASHWDSIGINVTRHSTVWSNSVQVHHSYRFGREITVDDVVTVRLDAYAHTFNVRLNDETDEESLTLPLRPGSQHQPFTLGCGFNSAHDSISVLAFRAIE
eukprot:gnl/Dysnectes_brevis/2483_a2969_690.p1 GENE.gnl/Dysnectes_brevis/2483_a2969_690~~gnl/Dysnectes_brevis/2483_a2969_690.p1  ORF type:complete len:1033 (+),score=196.72 gnl/Dysnectes_brevis/2483_a2969_690:64-3099(+)